MSNVFHAAKITFANEAGAALAALGVDVREAFDLFCADSVLNISANYLGPGFAFGGSCLPKDVSAFLHLAEGHGVAVPFLASLPAANQVVLRRALELIDPQPGRSVALFGLAFKPGSDDVRGSPYVTLATELLARDCKLRIIDPLVRLAWGALPDGPPANCRGLASLLVDDVLSSLAGTETVILGHVAPQHLDVLNAGLADKFSWTLPPDPSSP